jgi:hypothetical protein
MVGRAERDRLVLSLLAPGDRVLIEAVVDELLEEAPPLLDELYMLAAADAFDARAGTLPDDEKVVAWQIAAALRERTNPVSPLH